MAAIESVGHTQNRGKAFDPFSRFGIELTVVRMLRPAGLPSAMIPRDVRDDDLTRRRNPEQVRVPDEV